MPPHLQTSTLGFGEYTSLPSLPDDWVWHQNRNDWLYVENDVSEWFYVHFLPNGTIRLDRRRTAGIWDWIRTFGALRIGSFYVDAHYSYLLSKRGNVLRLK